ncbi:hypothetical protein P280DRAFT_387053, partial [Massarina eburnea CBS 473.64]
PPTAQPYPTNSPSSPSPSQTPPAPPHPTSPPRPRKTQPAPSLSANTTRSTAPSFRNPSTPPRTMLRRCLGPWVSGVCSRRVGRPVRAFWRRIRRLASCIFSLGQVPWGTGMCGCRGIRGSWLGRL